MNDKNKLLAKISACRFAQIELVLFLDTHPNCREAMKALNMHRANAIKLIEEYECKFGPLSNPKANGEHWDWIDDPWPWEYVSEATPYFSNCGRCGKGACR